MRLTKHMIWDDAMYLLNSAGRSVLFGALWGLVCDKLSQSDLERLNAVIKHYSNDPAFKA